MVTQFNQKDLISFAQFLFKEAENPKLDTVNDRKVTESDVANWKHSQIKGNKVRDDEHMLSVCAGGFNGLLGMGIDGLHPLVYPARMLSPLLLQPIFKLMKADPCKAMVDDLTS